MLSLPICHGGQGAKVYFAVEDESAAAGKPKSVGLFLLDLREKNPLLVRPAAAGWGRLIRIQIQVRRGGHGYA